jgi:hypothetical protein
MPIQYEFNMLFSQLKSESYSQEGIAFHNITPCFNSHHIPIGFGMCCSVRAWLQMLGKNTTHGPFHATIAQKISLVSHIVLVILT